MFLLASSYNTPSMPAFFTIPTSSEKVVWFCQNPRFDKSFGCLWKIGTIHVQHKPMIMTSLMRQLSTTQEGSLSTLGGKVHNHCRHSASGIVILVESSNTNIQIEIQIQAQIQMQIQIQTQKQGSLSALGGEVHPSTVTLVESWTTQDASLSISMGHITITFWNIEGRCLHKYDRQAQNWKQTQDNFFGLSDSQSSSMFRWFVSRLQIQFCTKCLNISRWQEGQKCDGVVIKFEHGRSWPTSVNNWA